MPSQPAALTPSATMADMRALCRERGYRGYSTCKTKAALADFLASKGVSITPLPLVRFIGGGSCEARIAPTEGAGAEGSGGAEIGRVQLDHCTLAIIGHASAANSPPFEPDGGPPSALDKCVPVLKSNLQKAIRRREDIPAVLTAYSLYVVAPVDLFRRLTIIMLEDCTPDPVAFSRLVWWLCATSKGHRLTVVEAEDLFGIIIGMCASEAYVPFDKARRPLTAAAAEPTLQQFDAALAIRRSYRGMHCDTELVDYHRAYWSYAENARLLRPYAPVAVVTASLRHVQPRDILEAALDYHPYPWIIGKLAKQEEDVSFDPDDMRAAVWLCESRVNLRTPLHPPTVTPPRLGRLYETYQRSLGGIRDYIRTAILIPILQGRKVEGPVPIHSLGKK